MHDAASLAAGHASAFADALLAPETPLPDGLAAPGRSHAGPRFDIYRNNVMLGLIGALGANFPTVRRLLGDDTFTIQAARHIRRHPPRSRLLFEYGVAFAEHLAAAPDLADRQCLADVARLERSRIDAYHAADAPVLQPEDFTAASDLSTLVLVGHPAAKLLRFGTPAASIVRTCTDQDPAALMASSTPEIALVTRPRFDVLTTTIPVGTASFVESLMAGMPLGAAAERSFEDDDGFDLPEAIGVILSTGAFAGPLNAS